MVQNKRQLPTHEGTLIMLLKEQIDELQQGVIEMREQSLVKNVAKRKVVYNLTKEGDLELVYALLALSQYYQSKELIDSSIRCLQEARQLKNIGDAGYLLGTAYLKKEQKDDALHWLQICLDEEWIEPSAEHRAAAKLEAMTKLQQLYFQMGMRDKLLDLSYRKIQQARENSTKSQNHFHALSLIDMALVHEALGEREMALEKIDGAIALLESGVDEPGKLVEAWIKRGELLAAQNKPELVPNNYSKACQVIKKYPGCVDLEKEANLLEVFIQSYILN